MTFRKLCYLAKPANYLDFGYFLALHSKKLQLLCFTGYDNI